MKLGILPLALIAGAALLITRGNAQSQPSQFQPSTTNNNLDLGGIRDRTPEQQFNRDIRRAQQTYTEISYQEAEKAAKRDIEMAALYWNSTHSAEAKAALDSARQRLDAIIKAY